jgi:tetratricopeptide (TPR) repeat protein
MEPTMQSVPGRVAALVVTLVGLGSLVPAQDMLQLTDGRFLTAPSMTRTPEGIKVHFENGDVFVKKDLVREASASKVEGGPAEPPPPDAADKGAKGFVRFEGKWIKKEQRDQVLEGRRKERARKIKEAMDRREWRNRLKLTTANFEFEYTIDPEVMKEFAALMEEYYKVFLKEWKITKPGDMGKLKVCFYHDPDTYYQVSGAPRGAIGYFRFVKPIELNFYFDRNDRALTTLVMFHETNHYLTHLIDPDFRYPIWINESLAEYYGASQWDPATKKMEVGFLQEGRLTAIQDHILDGKWQGLEELIRLEHGAFNADHYAWGWSFVHYLLQNKKYGPKFKSFYVALAREQSIKTAALSGYGSSGPRRTIEADEVIRTLLRYLGVKDLKTLEKEWHEYVKGLKPASGRGYAEAGEMYEMFGMPIKARRYYETAIEKGDKRPVVYYGLGRTLERKNEFEKAQEAFKSAIAGDPLNGIYYAVLARAIQNQTRNATEAECVRLRKLALEVDPDNLELIQMLSFDDAARKALEGLKDKAESRPGP